MTIKMVHSARSSNRLKLDDPNDGLTATRKIFSSTIDGEETIYAWQGKVYSHVPGERDRHLFNIEGMNIRTTQTHKDEQRGVGFRMLSKEVMLFLDSTSNETLREWTNPWTDQRVKIFHVANDPVNSRPIFPNKHGFEGNILNGKVLLSYQIPLFYDNPLIGMMESNQHENYHALEMFDFFLSEQDLTDEKSPRVSDITIAWNRISQWEPWMQMGDKKGELIFDAAGTRVGSWNELSRTLRNEIEQNYPKFQTPPPLDDARTNQTTWRNYKEWLIARQSNT